jgi:hypothetical protein
MEILFYFGGLQCVGNFFAYVAHLMIFKGCLDSIPEVLSWQAGAVPT